MKSAELRRISSSVKGTFGVLTVDGMPFCVTLEPPWRMNEENISCIPTGQYICKPYSSEDYPDVYQIMDVHGRTVVLIHIGNYLHETEGCVLLGSSYGELKGEPAILSSKIALDKFREAIGKNKFRLTITER